MTRFSSLALLLALTASAAAATSHTVLEADRRHDLPHGWKVQGDTPRNVSIELVFAVKQTNLKQLETVLLDVSDPRSTSYGQHLSSEEVHTLVAPRKEHLNAVRNFLDSHGATYESMTPNSDFIVTTVPVEVAERMLAPAGHRYQQLTHVPSGKTIHRLRSRGYELPSAVAKAVDLVAPTTHVPTVRAQRRSSAPGATPDSLINDPQILRKLYGVGDTDIGKAKTTSAVTGFIGQTYSEGSLAAFYKYFCGANQSFTCGMNNNASAVRCKGDACPGLGGTEAMLDIEYITALGAGIPTEFWGFSGNNPYAPQQEPFLKWLYLVGNTSDADVPRLFSTSYGEDESMIPLAWSERTNTEFQKVGARGISLLFASGDSGAAGDNGCAGPKNDIFVPQWPSGSPYVTAVGGTAGIGTESVAGLSSGGFSNRWKRPSWQTDATAAYLNGSTGAKLPGHSHFNDTGRGFPDIAAQAVDFVIVQFGIPLPGVSGTSCASPTAAGVFGLLNDVRAQAGKPSLGFLNPFIYQNAHAFNDITSGSNNGCGFGTDGFPAAKGWDAATGVGTPNFPKLKEAALSA